MVHLEERCSWHERWPGTLLRTLWHPECPPTEVHSAEERMLWVASCLPAGWPTEEPSSLSSCIVFRSVPAPESPDQSCRDGHAGSAPMAGTLALVLGVSFFVHLYRGQFQESPGCGEGEHIFIFQQMSHIVVGHAPTPVPPHRSRSTNCFLKKPPQAGH